jgi:hypothetical protein
MARIRFSELAKQTMTVSRRRKLTTIATAQQAIQKSALLSD